MVRSIPALALAAALASGLARAGTCYDERGLPAVVGFEDERGVLRADLGGALYDGKSGQFPVMELVENEGWVLAGTSRCTEGACGYTPAVRHRAEACAARLPKISLTEKEARKLRPELPKGTRLEQRISACVESEGALWFGIAFQEGRGVGGVGRFDLATKKLQVRRPPLLRAISVTRLAHDGARLWLGTESLAGCIGPNVAEGLVAYDWVEDRARSFKGAEQGPCGFVVHALTWRNGGLWMASDLGISRFDPDAQRWRQLVPVREGGTLRMREETCDALYLRLLPELSTVPGSTRSYGSARDQLVHALREFRPRFAAQHLEAEGE